MTTQHPQLRRGTAVDLVPLLGAVGTLTLYRTPSSRWFSQRRGSELSGPHPRCYPCGVTTARAES